MVTFSKHLLDDVKGFPEDDAGIRIDFEGLFVVSGEGAGPGMIEPYTGKATAGALRARLTVERCGGDRWAYALGADGTRYDLEGGAS